MQNQERTQQHEQTVNDHVVAANGKNDEAQLLAVEQGEKQPEAIDADLPSTPEDISKQVSFDRYEIIGLLLLMYGWWKMLAQSWVFAIALLGVGWLLAFATGDRRNGFIRILGGVSKDILNVSRSLVQKISKYLTEKKKTGSDNHGDGAQ